MINEAKEPVCKTKNGDNPTVYIASSWKNQHAVEMLTDILTERGYEVRCFVRHSADEREFADTSEEWVGTDRADKCFQYDTEGATTSDVLVYIGPSGTDAWAEVGAAWARGIPIVGLWAKGEQAGLMRKMVSYWVTDYTDVFPTVAIALAAPTCGGSGKEEK